MIKILFWQIWLKETLTDYIKGLMRVFNFNGNLFILTNLEIKSMKHILQWSKGFGQNWLYAFWQTWLRRGHENLECVKLLKYSKFLKLEIDWEAVYNYWHAFFNILAWKVFYSNKTQFNKLHWKFSKICCMINLTDMTAWNSWNTFF